MECLVLSMVLLLVLAAIPVSRRWLRARVLASLAEEHEGWSFDGRVLSGPVGDGTVALTVSPSWLDPGWSVSVHSDWLDARVVRPPAHVVLSGAVDTGDKHLDRAVAIVGPSHRVLASLTPEGRLAIRRAVAYGFAREEGVWSTQRKSLSRSLPDVQLALGLAAELALQLQPPGELGKALEARLATESNAAVRLEILRARLEDETPLPAALHAELLERRDASTLLLARSMGEKGDAWIVEVMRHAVDDGTRWEALSMLWGRSAPPALAAALASFLDSSWSETAIRRLAEVGTVAEVPALRAVTERWFDARGKAAEKAIEAIQARARGEVGQLSVVEAPPEAGAVSVAQQAARAREGQGSTTS